MKPKKQVALNALAAIQKAFRKSEDYLDEKLAMKLEKKAQKAAKKDYIPMTKLHRKLGLT
ncbi:hypothetical protein COY87_02675 [Candidatus Roizmanbacteria bacterium CG_4_10_14_0_8_um_filter_33_9]|uniref:Uncharacterized protein n=1 Tax=Candidatus Roizmanbacteria bacterium CG_4_10_14_0_8_um_filter_33_9 TaxID=1974826 RepID=A0A2M7QJG2_9BACT|nr:MAG: hypothetical protein COY87_02675 [Candidatus Roizmanbacteria bacterium CG_4_10_14_0_8_um_filter_33_9]